MADVAEATRHSSLTRTAIARCRKWSGLPIGSHDRRDGIASLSARWQPEVSLLIRAKESPKGRGGSQVELRDMGKSRVWGGRTAEEMAREKRCERPKVARTTVAATQHWLLQWRFRRLWMALDTQKRAPVIEKPGADEAPTVQSLSREKPDRWAAEGALAGCPEKKSAVQPAFADCTADLCQTRIPPRGVEPRFSS